MEVAATQNCSSFSKFHGIAIYTAYIFFYSVFCK